LAEDLQAGLAPLLQVLVASQEQQVQLSQTLAAFAGWARQQVTADVATADTRRRPRVRRAATPEERALDEALMRHFYGESLPPEMMADDGPRPPPLP
jgi:hypothetical protein